MFKYERPNNVALSGPILHRKANDFTPRFGDQTFVCSSSLIQRSELDTLYRRRKNMHIYGEVASDDDGVVQEY